MIRLLIVSLLLLSGSAFFASPVSVRTVKEVTVDVAQAVVNGKNGIVVSPVDVRFQSYSTKDLKYGPQNFTCFSSASFNIPFTLNVLDYVCSGKRLIPSINIHILLFPFHSFP